MQNENPNKNSLIEEIKNNGLLTTIEIEGMIDKGVDPNERDDEDNTPLILLAQKQYCNLDFPKILLSKGADPNAKNKHDHIAFFFAMENNHLDLAELLIKHHTDVGTKDPVLIGAWMAWAHTNNKPIIVEFLREHSARG